MEKIIVRGKEGDRGVFANKQIDRNEKILDFSGRIIKKPHRYTLQIGEKMHLGKTGKAEDFINHSCDPNCFVKFEKNKIYPSLVALKKIKRGEKITFNYYTTEYDAEKFRCNCGSKNCYDIVKGFKYLPLKEKIKLKKWLSPYLKEKLKEEIKIQTS